MRTITISQSTHDAFIAYCVTNGWAVKAGQIQDDGRYAIEVSDDVLRSLQFLDPDPDRAIGLLLTNGFGHA